MAVVKRLLWPLGTSFGGSCRCEEVAVVNVWTVRRDQKTCPLQRWPLVEVRLHKRNNWTSVFHAAKMIMIVVFEMFILLVLFKAADGVANSQSNQSPSACNCQPVVKVSVDGNSDLCKGNDQLLQEVNDLKKQLTTITDQLSQIIQPACKFDFEGGIHGWDRTGTAFNNQPTYGDNPTARNRGQPARQQGDWWIGGYENRPSKSAHAGRIQGDKPQGTLTSPYFTITGKYIFYLIGGGCDINTVRAELIVDNKVIHRDTGKCTETMTRKTWDVGAFVGQRARVKLVDFSSAGWGHINFDDLRGDMSCGPN